MKKARYLLILLVLIMKSNFASAQLNESDTVKFQSRVSFTGIYADGNVKQWIVKSKVEFSSRIATKIVFKSQNNSLYQEFFKQKADNDIYSRNYLYYDPYKRVYPFAIGYVSANYRLRIDNRYFVGAGGTIQVIKRENSNLKFSLSGVYEATNFAGKLYNYSEYNGSKTINLWRGTAYAAGYHFLLGRKLKVFYDAYVQYGFNHTNNYRAQLDAGGEFPVYKGLSFNALYTYVHENVVLKGLQQDDRTLTFGIAYNYKTKPK